MYALCNQNFSPRMYNHILIIYCIHLLVSFFICLSFQMSRLACWTRGVSVFADFGSQVHQPSPLTPLWIRGKIIDEYIHNSDPFYTRVLVDLQVFHLGPRRSQRTCGLSYLEWSASFHWCAYLLGGLTLDDINDAVGTQNARTYAAAKHGLGNVWEVFQRSERKLNMLDTGCTLSIFLRWSRKFNSVWSSGVYGIHVPDEGGKDLESIGKPGSTSIGEHHPRGAGEAIEVLHLGIAEARSTGLRIISFSCCRHATGKPYQNQMWFDPQPMPTPYGLKIYPLLANPRYIQRLLHVENVSSVRELSMGVFFFDPRWQGESG